MSLKQLEQVLNENIEKEKLKREKNNIDTQEKIESIIDDTKTKINQIHNRSKKDKEYINELSNQAINAIDSDDDESFDVAMELLEKKLSKILK